MFIYSEITNEISKAKRCALTQPHTHFLPLLQWTVVLLTLSVPIA